MASCSTAIVAVALSALRVTVAVRFSDLLLAETVILRSVFWPDAGLTVTQPSEDVAAQLTLEETFTVVSPPSAGAVMAVCDGVMKAAGFWETLTVTALASPPVKVTVVSRGAAPV